MALRAGQGGAGCDVLIVDDDEATVEFLLTYLSMMNVNARGLTNSRDYMRDIRAANPRLVLLDVALPGTSGYKICSEIKKVKEMNKVRVVLFTAMPPADVAAGADNSGADGYLLKPFTLPGLNRAVGIVTDTRP